MRPGEGFTEQRVLELADLLRGIEAQWPAFVEILNDEALAAMRAGLFDTARPREYYAGYVSGLEFLAALPGIINERAEGIRENHEYEAKKNAPKVAETLRRNVTGGEVSGS